MYDANDHMDGSVNGHGYHVVSFEDTKEDPGNLNEMLMHMRGMADDPFYATQVWMECGECREE